MTYLRQASSGLPPDLVVGLVNNMPLAARGATEQHFTELLKAASMNAGGARIRVFVIETTADWSNNLRALREASPDGLIVTGTEPHGSSIASEPLWPALAELVGWAAEHTISTIWSCLAAHAVVFQMDGINRERLPAKLTGVFRCSKLADHPLLANTPPSWPVPHSRCNTLDEAALRSKGYVILSGAAGVGLDSFARQCGASLFLLLQGHPEYGPNTLLGEFRRDIRRFVSGQHDRYPEIPQDYFDPVVADALARLRQEAGRASATDLLSAVATAITVAPRQVWRESAVTLYANWLSYLVERKTERVGCHFGPAGATLQLDPSAISGRSTAYCETRNRRLNRSSPTR